jgi:uncharacterized protein (TIGR03437 family)
VAIAAGVDHHMALKSDGTVWEWPGPWISPAPAPPPLRRIPYQISDLTDVTAIAAGDFRSLAVKRDGTVWEWAGQPAADAAAVAPESPQQVSGLAEVVAVAVAYEAGFGEIVDSRKLALKEDGTVWVWNIGVAPSRLGELTGIVAIAAGPSSDVALKNDGTVWEWDERLRPAQVAGLASIVAVAAGSEGPGWAPWPGGYGLALKGDGTVWTWGYGQSPVQVDRLADVKSVAAAGVYAYTSGIRPVNLAIKRDGTVWSWGETWNAQLGDGTTCQRAISAASDMALVAPELLATLVAPTTATASASATPPWPNRLGGISLEVRDSSGATRLAPLIFVSPTQINFQVPAATALGEATLVIASDGGTIVAGSMQVAAVAPGLFMVSHDWTIPAATAVLVQPDGTQVPLPVFTCPGAEDRGSCKLSSIPLSTAGDRPIYLSLYGTGFRGANLSNVTCSISGVPVPVTYAGPQGTPGLDQINVRLPSYEALAKMARYYGYYVVVSINGVAANGAWIDLQ